MKGKVKGRFFRLWFLILFAIICAIAPVAALATQTVSVDTSLLNIRSGPGTTFAKVGQATAGQQFTVLEEKEGWLKIQLSDSSTGWLIKDYVKPALLSSNPESPKDPALGELVINGTQVNVRSGPGTTFSKITSFPQGTKVTAIDLKNDWYQISWSTGQGWIASWLVEPAPEKEATDIPAEQGIQGEVVEDLPPGQPEGTDVQSLSWNWTKTGSGIKITVQGTQPLGYSEKILAGEPKILLEFAGALKDGSNTETIDESGITKIEAKAEKDCSALVVYLSEEIPYQTGLSPDGCALTINTAYSGDMTYSGPTGKTVVIDPGHGISQSGDGYDPGAIGAGGLHESDVVLDIGQKVGDLLTREGFNVILTRPGRENLTLEGRPQIANEACADVFVSIHCNASLNATLNGTTTYFYAPVGSSLEEQRAVRQRLAAAVQSRLLEGLGRKDLGVREENYAVLRYTTVPSILVETAFISNSEEEVLLSDEQFRNQVAVSIVNGLKDFFSETNG
ncbi:N-acetylmuramoyl-L-alanine amidase [Candidatus Formimonas warabiya]|uniref:SH3b domain-containing protein n=1 Tax=Formimonas warabiya TaxID=1761012 RepID=A0A3G1KSP1_FORW1|nr:N-acetylmuramoyl-L-alanine amidase [Candidatus Formimonas warabiya]ATW25533.1 hypothetical protein DCMF_12865 [Candidatus Formimonas warabiya]